MRLIDADNLIERLKQFKTHTDETLYAMLLNNAIAVIDTHPTAKVQPVRRGEWIYKERHRGGFEKVTGFDINGETHTVTVDTRTVGKEPYCSLCGALAADSFMNYCPNCGAMMKGKDDE